MSGASGQKAQSISAHPAPGWAAEALTLFRKDLRAELRTKVAVSAVGIFTFTALLLLALATLTLREVRGVNDLRFFSVLEQTRDVEAALEAGRFLAWDAPGKMGLLWVLLSFAAFTGLAHSFVHEEETGTVTALRLSMSAGGVYAGKLLFNIVLVSAVAGCATPIYMAITGMPPGSPFVFILVMVSGCLGLAASATIVAALAAKARSTGALFSAIGLPFVAVFVTLLLNAARAVYTVAPSTMRVVRDVGGLFSFSALLIAISALVFHFIWEE